MDRVKAIKVLKPLVDSYVDYANISMKEEDDNIVEALEMAIEALDVPDTNVGDMISRRQAIDCVTYDVEHTIECLKALPSTQPEQRWAPVTERLPENDNEVLITIWDAEDDYVEVYKGFYQGHEWWTQWCHGCSKIKDEPCGENIVIAWRPLPEPYRGGGKE